MGRGGCILGKGVVHWIGIDMIGLDRIGLF